MTRWISLGDSKRGSGCERGSSDPLSRLRRQLPLVTKGSLGRNGWRTGWERTNR
nr:MAG TPA: hypothetical protein [Caudoviricetes sp.]